jgi:hypothetical protein
LKSHDSDERIQGKAKERGKGGRTGRKIGGQLIHR